MLTKCPECELQVSDKAFDCPHCGYPLQKPNRPYRLNSKRHRRLPNGFGQISEIKNRNLRKPFRAMVSVGKTETGRPIVKPLQPESYFASYNDAYAALVEYNKNPYELGESMLMNELYEKWSQDYYKFVDSESMQNHATSWKYCSKVYSKRVVDLRPIDILDCMNNGTMVNAKNGMTMTAGSKRKLNIKSLFNLMFDYAVEHGITERNIARETAIPKNIHKTMETELKSHIAFSEDEIQVLWDNLAKVPVIDIILIQIYSGWRPNELCTLRLEDVDLENWTFTGGSKTEAGKNRTIPIHPKIQNLVTREYDAAKANNMDYLINYMNSRGELMHLRYPNYSKIFINVMSLLQLNPEHRTHDCRKTFVTLAKKYNVDEYAIKHIVGHTITDITEKVYTERDIEWLRTEMEKIK